MPRVLPHPRAPNNRNWAILADFESNRAELRPEHTRWLDRRVVAPLRSERPPWVYLRGFASRLGQADDNETLSEQRVQSVMLYLLGFPFTDPRRFQSFTGLEAAGESWSQGDEDDDSPRWRSVEVIVTPQRLPQERPTPAPPARMVQRRVLCHLTRNPQLRGNLEPGWSEGGPSARASEWMLRNRSEGSVRGRLSCTMQPVPIHHRLTRIEHQYKSWSNAFATMNYLEVGFTWSAHYSDQVELVWLPSAVRAQSRREQISRRRAADIYTDVHLYLQENDPWY
ncbi:MAG: hypothetical protein AAF170_14220 [Bacteroidota bacterium]